MATYTLEIEENYNFELIGISSHEKDYRLAWSINRVMGWKMVRLEDMEVNGRKGVSKHARFRFIHPTDQTVVTLIDNKTPEGLFLPEIQQFDFVVKIENSREEWDDSFFKKLRSAPFVITAYRVDISKLKSKQSLLQEFN